MTTSTVHCRAGQGQGFSIVLPKAKSHKLQLENRSDGTGMDLSRKGKNCIQKIASRDESIISSAQESVGSFRSCLKVVITFICF